MRNIFKKKIMKIFNFYGSGNNKLSLPLLNIILELYQTAQISFDRYSAQKQNGKDAIGSLSSLLRHDLSQYIDIRLFSSDNCQKTNTCVWRQKKCQSHTGRQKPTIICWLKTAANTNCMGFLPPIIF